MISIFTPTHNSQYLYDCYSSLKEQSFQDWEWVIIPNNGAIVPDFKDPKVKVYPFEKTGEMKIGELKNFACSKCTGDILVEYDHDDLLTPDCLEEIHKAFQEPTVTMIYSDFTQMDMNWTPQTWSEYYGWKFYDFEYKGHKLKASHSPEPYPSNLGRIWFAPNHVRAWRTKDYWRIGGHDKTMKISDDHDIVARNYLHGKIVHIPKCLYVYRVHGKNTWLGLMQEIQDTMWDNYVKYIIPIMEKWSDDNKLSKIDLCGGINKRQGYTSVDLQNADIMTDLEKDWPIADDTVGLIWANDAVEHMKDPIHTMNEAWRILTHGGVFIINVPSALGQGGFCDPTHKSYWVKRSFRYYTEAQMRKYIEPACKCKFQVMKLSEGKLYDDIPYIFAHLIALKKEEPRFHGSYDW